MRKKDMLIIKSGSFLGIEEHVDGRKTYKYTAKVLSSEVKLLRINLEVT